jgi:hypothetical protein
MLLSFKKNPPPPTINTRIDEAKAPEEQGTTIEAPFFSRDGPEMVLSPRSMTSQEYIPLMEHDPFDSFFPASDAEFVHEISCMPRL